jgi:hypothetical protein
VLTHALTTNSAKNSSIRIALSFIVFATLTRFFV